MPEPDATPAPAVRPTVQRPRPITWRDFVPPIASRIKQSLGHPAKTGS